MKKTTHQNGSAILFALAMLSVITLGALYFSGIIQNYARANSSVKRRSKVQIEGENIARIALNYAEYGIRQDFNITGTALTTYLNQMVPPHLSPGYSIDALTAIIAASQISGSIPSGPFVGMNTVAQPMTLHVRVRDTTFNIAADTTIDASVGEIFPTQFNVFSSDWIAIENAAVTIQSSGRVYAGQVATFGACCGPPTYATSVTTPTYYNWQGYPVAIATKPNPAGPSDYVVWPFNNMGPPPCSPTCGNGMQWYTYSRSLWNGQFQDGSWGISELNFLDDPSRLIDVTNIKSIQTNDIAMQADIRILNGVWFIKDPNNSSSFPGIPVWSDHTGHFTSWNEENIEGTFAVGQEDIRSWLNTSGPVQNQWPNGTTPHLYSYYELDPTTGLVSTDQSGTVSYGNLARTTNGIPGNWTAGDYVGDFLCVNSATCQDCGTSPNLTIQPVTTTTFTCTDGNNPAFTTRILNATRGGFRNGSIEQAGQYYSRQSKVWPMNFDLTQFAQALKCGVGSHPGEIGCYFGAGNFMGRAFNGVVYIANTWPGFRSSAATWPFMQNDAQVFAAGNNIDAGQVPAHQAQQQLLPFQLCSTSLAGQPFDAAAGTNRFVIPNCANYHNSAVFAGRINAVRVLNGSVNPNDFPKGLTIYTPDDMYTLGNMNDNSNLASVNSTPWMAMFLGGSNYWALSNGWDDFNARWDVPTYNLSRTAIATTINAGLSPQVPSLTFNENWGGANFTHRGPSVQFPNSINKVQWNFYTGNILISNWILYLGSETFWNPPTINMTEDPHFQLVSNQPPGIQGLSVFAISTWSKRNQDEISADSAGP